LAVLERKAPGGLDGVGMGRCLERRANQVIDDVERELSQTVIDAAIACLLLFVGRPPTIGLSMLWRPGQSGTIQRLVVNELPEVFLARAHEGSAAESAGDLLQHGPVRLRLRVGESIGPQDQSTRDALESVRLRLDTARPRHGLEIE